MILSSLFLLLLHFISYFFFFNDTATTEIYTLSLHDALPIWGNEILRLTSGGVVLEAFGGPRTTEWEIMNNISDRKSTRLNSSHVSISYAVFCLKKKKKKKRIK